MSFLNNLGQKISDVSQTTIKKQKIWQILQN